MKKFVVVLALILLLLPSAAYAGQITVNGQVLNAETQMYNGRTLVPMRAIFEALGATVDWNAKEGIITAYKGDTEVQLSISSPIALINGKEVVMDTPVQLVLDRTLVPLRFVSNALGAEVNWDGSTKTVTITYAEEEQKPNSIINGLKITVDGTEEASPVVDGEEKKVVIIKLTVENVVTENRGIGVGNFSLLDQNGTKYDYLTYSNFAENISYEEELFRSPPANIGSILMEPGQVHEGKLGFTVPLTAQNCKLLIETLDEQLELDI